MKINIVCVGNIKEKFYVDAVNEYVKRLSKYHNVNIVEVAESKLPKNASPKEIEISKVNESKLLQNNVKGYVILLDIGGKRYDSVGFSKYLYGLTNNYHEVSFVIGGSNGVSDEFRASANAKLSFSDFTFPHQLMRVVLMEQLYRATTIANNITYHK